MAWVKKYFQAVSFDEEVCYRDAGYMVDGICYDMLFNSNFASIKCGLSYYRGTTSTIEVLTNEKQASVGAVNFIKHKLRRTASITADVAIGTVIDDITNSINGGKVPSIRWPSPTNIASGYQGAATLIWDNKAFLQAEVIQYITNNYPSLYYSAEACSRDVGLIIDAIRYDLTYGGNSESKVAGKAYYSFSTLQIDANDKAATLAAYGYLKTLIQSVSTDTLVVSPLQVAVTQTRADSLQTPGSVAASNAAGALMDVITNIIGFFADVCRAA